MSNKYGYSDIKDIPTRALLNLKGGNSSSGMPNQAIPISRKGPTFYKKTLEHLEKMGLNQIRRNYKYNDAYAQIEGKVIVSHYLQGLSKYEKLAGSMLDADTYEIPEYIKNYDRIGPIVKHIATKYVELNSNYNVDFTDPVSQSEFDREINNKLMQATLERFALEKARREAMWGIGQDVEGASEEEIQQAQQQAEEQLKLVSNPEEIIHSVQKEWKPSFIKWINSKLKSIDRNRTNRRLYTKLVIDKLATGKYFIEHKATPDGEVDSKRWDPRYVFHSQNHDLEFPQDSNIIGTIDKISVDNLITEHGDSLTEGEIKKLINFRDSEYSGDKKENTKKLKDVFYGDRKYGVFPGTFANQALSNLEARTGIPQTFVIKDFGDVTGIKSEFINSYMTDSPGDLFYRKYTRTDITSDDDVILRTRVYWTSYEKVSYLFIEDDGVIERYFVDERLLEDYVKRHNIKKVKNITISELEQKERDGDIEPNTMCSTYAPVTYYGTLLRTEGFGLKEDKIIEEGPCKIQLRGEGNDIYKEIKPVTGIIGEAEIPKWMPYQIQYNYNQNLARKYSEKELGKIFLFDVGLSSPEFSDTGDIRDDFMDMQDRMREDAMVPVDASRKNLREGRGMEYNPIGVYDMSMTDIIQAKMTMAQNWLMQLYQAIGINPQSVEEPHKYVTAEGIKQSQDVTQTSLDYIFNQMDEAKAKDIDIHIRLLQRNQIDKEKIEFEEIQDDGSKILREFMDEFISERSFEITALESSDRRRKQEELKNWILQTNTLQDDTYALASIILSEDFTTMINTLRVSQEKAKEEIRIQQEQEREHELNLSQQQEEARMEQMRFQEQAKEEERNARLKEKIMVELIKNYRRNGTDIPESTVATIKDLLQQRKIDNDKELSEEQLRIASQKNDFDNEISQRRLDQEQQKIDNEKRRLELRERERNSDNFRSIMKSK